MKKYGLLWRLGLLAGILMGCEPYAPSDLEGEWQAISLTEEGDSLAVDLADIGFTFRADGGYTFRSTLKYQESGTFRLEGPYLFSTDTTSQLPQEKAVKIVSLGADSLQLEMQEMGKTRILWLVKQ